MARSILALAALVLGFACAARALAGTPASEPDPSIAQASALLDEWRGQPETLRQAKALLLAVLEQHPRNARAHRELARYHIMSGYLGGAEVRPEALAAADQSLKLAIEIDPNFAEAHVLRGQLYVLMKKLPMARAALTTAEQIGTDDPWLQLNWAELLKAEGRGDEVAGRYRHVLASGTTNKKARGAALEGLIEYHKHLGELDEADRLYHEHIALDPTSAWSYGNYARFLLCYRDDFDGAIEQAGRGLARMDYWAGRAVLGAALTRKWAEQLTHGKADEAERTRKPLAAVDLDADAVKLYKEVCPRGSATGTIERAVAIFRASRPAILRRGPESQPAKD